MIESKTDPAASEFRIFALMTSVLIASGLTGALVAGLEVFLWH